MKHGKKYETISTLRNRWDVMRQLSFKLRDLKSKIQQTYLFDIKNTENNRIFDPYILFLTIAIIGYIGIFSYVSLLRHWTYYSAYFDLGGFEQPLWSTIQGHFFYVSYINSSHFGVHNSPILFLLIPLYQIFPYSETLLITQTILLAFGAIPLFFIGKIFLDSRGGLVFSLSYLLYPALHGVNLFDFHELAFIPLLIFLTFFSLFTKRFKWFICFSLLALMVKEDVSILLLAITIFALFFRLYDNQKQKRIMYILICIYLVWLYLSLFLISPYFNTSGYYLHSGRYDFSHGMVDIFSHNLVLKIIYLVLLFLPLGFTPLAAPDFLVISFPSFAEILLQSNIAYRITTQYSALVLPIIFISSIIGFKRIITIYFRTNNAKKIVYSLILIISFMSCLICTPAPVSPFTLYYHFSPNSCNFTLNEHVMHINDAISLISDESSVTAQNNLAGHLSRRMNIFTNYQQNVDYILIDNQTKNLEWLNPPIGAFPEEKYRRIYHVDGICLYKLKENY